MGRRSEINYHPSKGAYRTMYLGQRYTLHKCDSDDKPDGPNYRAALAAFHAIVDEQQKNRAGVGTVADLVRDYLEQRPRMENRRSDSALSVLSRFAADHSELPVSKLDNSDVFEWIDGFRHWKPGTKGHALNLIKAAFSWGLKHKRYQVNPLATLYRPKGYQGRKRGGEFVIPDDLAELLIGEATGRFRELLIAFRHTGARPVELENAEYYHYHAKPDRIVYKANAPRGYIWKNADKFTKGDPDRTIRLKDVVAEIVRENVKARGWIFQPEWGGRYTYTSMHRHWGLLMERKRVQEWYAERGMGTAKLTLYAWRHTWITRAMEAGLSVASVAALAGTSIQMINDHYGHIGARGDYLQGEFNRVT